MIVRVLFVFLLSMMFATGLALAADLPLQVEHPAPTKPKKLAVLPKKAAVKPKHLVNVPDAPKLVSSVTNPPPEQLPQDEPTTTDLSWVLGPLVANADGGKNEGSASATANLAVDRPGDPCGPEMIIELEGHIIKTANSTVRLDVRVGKLQRSVTWNEGEIKSGAFKITITEKVPVGTLPEYMPASALAFVTKKGSGDVALISLEKITVRRSKPAVASAQ